MKDLRLIKNKIIIVLNLKIDNKIQALQKTIADISDSMKNDTKSSAGDKFETGREMMQTELSKQQDQLNQQLRLKKNLKQLNPNKASTSIEFGSLVHTNKGIYFMAIPHGKLSIGTDKYYVLSMASPIGQAMKGAKTGDTITFNGQNWRIEKLL